MSLDHVVIGGAHVDAHNLERDFMNSLAAAVADLQANAQLAANAGGPIAYAENITAVKTVGPSVGAVIPGLTITIPPTTRDVWVEWGGQLGINVGGQGQGGMGLFDWTNGAFPPGPLDWAMASFSTNQAATNYGPVVFGKFRIGPVASDRVLSVGISTTQEGPDSHLSVFVRNGGLVPNTDTYARSWMGAYAL